MFRLIFCPPFKKIKLLLIIFSIFASITHNSLSSLLPPTFGHFPIIYTGFIYWINSIPIPFMLLLFHSKKKENSNPNRHYIIFLKTKNHEQH